MKNKEIAQIFLEISDYLKTENIPFKPYAYERAANALESLKGDIEEIYQKEGLKALNEISGVGKSMAEKIKEYLETGKIDYYEELKEKTPFNLKEIIAVEGMGPKRAKILYEKLGVRTLKDLEKTAQNHKIAPLFGFGEKTEKNILEGIAFLKRSKGRFLLGDILPLAKEIRKKLIELEEIKEVSVAGSTRRMKETIGDIDFLIISHPPKRKHSKEAAEKIMNFFTSLPGVIKVWSKGTTKASIRLRDGLDVDIRIVPQKSYGAALQYFTGSKEHNIVLRKIAMSKGLKLSEYGLFKGPKMIAGKSEKEIYQKLGMAWIPSELRENRGEIGAALRQAQGKLPGLPKLIDYKDIKGDLHCHSSWNGGANTILETAEAAISMGYQYLGIADHTKFLRIENGLDEKELGLQRKEIDKINSKFKIKNSKFRILQGCEANILKDGSLDIKDEALKKLDYAIAGIHSSLKLPRQKMTERIIKAMKNPYINIISHPTGRILKRRDEYQIDFDKILRVAKEKGIILEINSFPQRLDLNDQNIRRAKKAGVKMIINSDSHHKDQLKFIEYGIAQARRGWAEKKDIMNAQSLDILLKFFKK